MRASTREYFIELSKVDTSNDWIMDMDVLEKIRQSKA